MSVNELFEIKCRLNNGFGINDDFTLCCCCGVAFKFNKS